MPCHAPTRAPIARPRMIPIHQLRFQSRIAMATQMPTNAATEPTERSMWPAMMTSTMPMARTRM